MDSYLPIITAIITGAAGFLLAALKKQSKEFAAIKHGVQALLRNDMLNAYQLAKKNGYVTIADKQNFDNLYYNYHALGLNGVMDSIHEEYLKIKVEENEK